MNKTKKNAVVYPVDREFAILFRYKDLFQQYDKLIPVSPNGYGFNNKDVGEIDKGEKLGITISNDFINSICQVQEVIFTVFSMEIYKMMQYSIHSGKDIMCLFSLNEEHEKSIQEECLKYKVRYTNCTSEKNKLAEQLNYNDKIKEIKVPILLICGLSENTQKFDLQLDIRKKFVEAGYNIAQVGSKDYSQFFGMHNFPSYMFENNNEIEKIMYFNKFVKNIETIEKPDLIIIGVPGGVMPYDTEHPNGFGIMNYLVSNAVSADYVILSLAYNDYDDDFFEYILNYMRYRYDYSVVKFHLSNIFHDIYNDERVEGERYVYIGQQSIDSKTEELKNHNVFQVRSTSKNNSLITDIVDYLSN